MVFKWFGKMTRREWLACTGTLLASACRRPKGSGYPGYALIAVSGDKSLSVVDLQAFRLVKSLRLPAAPAAVVPGRVAAYVLTPSIGTVHVIDRKLQLAASSRFADELSEIRLMPDGKQLVAISAASRGLIEVDPTSLKVIVWHRLEAQPVSLDVAQTGYVAISTGRNGTVELFNLTTGQHNRTRLSGEIGAVRFRADGQLLLVANFHDRSLTALHVPSLQVVADLPLAMQPQNLCFNFDQGQLFVSGEGMDGIAIVFPFKVLEVEQTILAGRDPGVMACSGNPADLFVASHSGSDVCILNIDTRKIVGIVDVGQTPSYIAITPDSQYALVLNKTSGYVAVIHIPANSPTVRADRYKMGASLFTIIPVGGEPVHAAIVPRLLG